MLNRTVDLPDPQIATAAARIKGAPIRGVRAGKWLTAEQAVKLLAAPDVSTFKGKRDRALLAVLIGSGLRREELAHLEVADLEEREGRCVIPELVGKGQRVRLVPVPCWVKDALDAWTATASIVDGRLFRSIRKGGKLGDGLSVKAIWQIVLEHAKEIGVERLGPHDLRRTCARLCNDSGGDLVQIQMLLGHSSAEVTRRYIGGGQKIKNAVNDQILHRVYSDG